MDAQNQWPPLRTEVLPWSRDPEDLALVPKSRRRRVLPQYEAAVPLEISQRSVNVPHDLMLRIEALSTQLARFDAETAARGFNLPALLLRSESSSSSQIEHLTSSVRNVALAEISDRAPQNARLIAANVEAVRVALSLRGSITTSSLINIQDVLMRGHGTGIRTEQVWIGGSQYSPHGALFVPPAWSRVPSCLDDLCAFLKRSDVSPLVKAAVAHAQFETIHPFVDGNGRTGRALLHLVLCNEGLLEHSMLPVSAGLLHYVDTYMDSLDRYHEGDPVTVISVIADALEIALDLGRRATGDIEEVLDGWDAIITERKGAAIHRLPAVLVEQPVVNVAYVSKRLGITPRAATNLVARAEELRILRRVGTARRGVYYQADELISVLEGIASVPSIKRTSP